MTERHPVLGLLTYEDVYELWSVNFEMANGKSVKFRLSTWTGTDPKVDTQELFERGFQFLKWFQENEATLKEKIAEDLLKIYNEIWSLEEEGGLGLLSKDKFLDHITIDSIVFNTHQDSFCDYRDGGLFGDHSIEVRVNQELAVRKVGLAG